MVLTPPIILYVKLAVVAAVIGGISYGTWHLRGIIAEKAQNKAVSEAVQDIKGRLDEEKALRIKTEKEAEAKVSELLKSITTLTNEYTLVTKNIASERARQPSFYKQPLPPQGYEQWKRARQLVATPPALAASSGR